jgi:hypothetical protein
MGSIEEIRRSSAKGFYPYIYKEMFTHTYMIDALNECISGLRSLLDLIL